MSSDHSSQDERLVRGVEDQDVVIDEVLSPVPPSSTDAGRLKHEQIEVSASPAFQSLDKLFADGVLTGTRVAQLKSKYTQLHETLLKSRAKEMALLQETKSFSQQIQDNHTDLNKASEFPENAFNDVAKARQQLLRHSNELQATDERVYQKNYKIENLEEELQILRRDYERMPKAEDLEKQLKEATKEITELERELANRGKERTALTEEFNTGQAEVEREQEELNELAIRVEDLKGELVGINNVPNEVGRECERIAKHKHEEESKLDVVETTCKGIIDDIRNTESHMRKCEDERDSLGLEIERLRALQEERERECADVLKEHAYAKEREDMLIGDRSTLDINLVHLERERRNELEILARCNHDRERAVRALKKAELRLRAADDSRSVAEQIHEKAKHALAEHPRDMMLGKDLISMRKEVELKKKELANQQGLTAAEQRKVEETMKQEEKLLFTESDLRIEVVELSRLAAIKHDEREQKARDLKRAEQRDIRTREELTTRKLQINDHAKKLAELKSREEEFSKLYSVLKNERNKCVNQIQISTQKAAEMREKLKILQNEMEILRTSVAQKDRDLQAERLQHVAQIVQRDSLRNEVSKQMRILSDMRDQRDQQKMDIAKLNMLINQNEEQMVTLRKQYETAVQQRNDRGVQLIERNEEVCIFYEKVNIQDRLLRQSQQLLLQKEEEIRYLEMEKKEQERQRDLSLKMIPEERSQRQQLTTLQIQLGIVQKRLLELEKQVESPEIEERVRFIEGNDLTPADLYKKIEELEKRLADKEEQLLEKQLIFEQITRLTDRVHGSHTGSRDDTLALSKRVNEMQAKIKSVTRKMMAQVAELSMEQAKALKMQLQLRNKENLLEECYTRMDRGDAPCEQWLNEWQKFVSIENARSVEASRAAAVTVAEVVSEVIFVKDEEQLAKFTLVDGSATTAEPRPNAYLPEEAGELPIPRPYGKHAPFKPQDSSANMRHIRKPQLKPIEI